MRISCYWPFGRGNAVRAEIPLRWCFSSLMIKWLTGHISRICPKHVLLTLVHTYYWTLCILINIHVYIIIAQLSLGSGHGVYFTVFCKFYDYFCETTRNICTFYKFICHSTELVKWTVQVQAHRIDVFVQQYWLMLFVNVLLWTLSS